MNILSLVKASAGILLVLCAYFFGLNQGKNSEELKNARSKITALERTIKEFKAKQTSDSLALAQLRVDESARRNELDRMRQQLANIERMSGANANRERNRCLRLAIEGKELLEEASRAIKFCAENHK